MKRYNRLSLLAVLFGVFCLAGCEPEDPGFEDLNGMRTITIGVTHEGSATKADIGEDLKFSWTPGDQIAVYAGDRYYTSAGYVSKDEYTVSLSGIRTNYAVYPATIANPEFTGASADKPLKVDIPAEYDFRSASDTWSPMPMVAVNVEDEDLDFMHLGGLLRIAIGSLHEDASYVIVKLDKPINGTFPVHIVSDGSYISNATPDEIENGTNQAKFLVPSSGSVVLNLPVPVGTYGSVTVNVCDAAGTVLASESPDFSWNCLRAHGKKLTSDSFGWIYVLDNPQSVTVSYVGTMFEGTTASLGDAFKSYKYRGSGANMQKRAVPYKLQYRYSKNGVEDWYDEAPDWLPEAPTAKTGSVDGEALPLEVAPQYNTGTDPHRDVLRSKTPNSKLGLATINVATGETVANTTANCYVVQAPGTYTFPAVYGNGLKNGAVNESAYRRQQNTSTSVYYPLYLFDHTGAQIQQPYIALQPSVAGKTLTAKVLWTDAINLVTNVSVKGTGESAYIYFKVPEDRICQGNALVALLADGVIVWSWHIWVTDEDLTATIDVPSVLSANFSQVNLGWCTGRTEVYEQRSCLVRAVQTEEGGLETPAGEEGTISQTAKTIRTLSNNPYYQWGRKDPIQAFNMWDNEDKVYYPTSAAYQPQNSVAGPVSIGEAIQHPYMFYTNNGVTVWNDGYYLNLWNTLETDASSSHSYADLDDVIKTVYDPCPVGFVAPSLKAWSALYETPSEEVDATETDPPGRVDTATGLFFPMNGSRSPEEGIVSNAGTYGSYWAPQHSVSNGAHGCEVTVTIRPDAALQANFTVGMCIRPIREDIIVTGENLFPWDD